MDNPPPLPVRLLRLIVRLLNAKNGALLATPVAVGLTAWLAFRVLSGGVNPLMISDVVIEPIFASDVLTIEASPPEVTATESGVTIYMSVPINPNRTPTAIAGPTDVPPTSASAPVASITPVPTTGPVAQGRTISSLPTLTVPPSVTETPTAVSNVTAEPTTVPIAAAAPTAAPKEAGAMVGIDLTPTATLPTPMPTEQPVAVILLPPMEQAEVPSSTDTPVPNHLVGTSGNDVIGECNWLRDCMTTSYTSIMDNQYTPSGYTDEPFGCNKSGNCLWRSDTGIMDYQHKRSAYAGESITQTTTWDGATLIYPNGVDLGQEAGLVRATLEYATASTQFRSATVQGMTANFKSVQEIDPATRLAGPSTLAGVAKDFRSDKPMFIVASLTCSGLDPEPKEPWRILYTGQPFADFRWTLTPKVEGRQQCNIMMFLEGVPNNGDALAPAQLLAESFSIEVRVPPVIRGPSIHLFDTVIAILAFIGTFIAGVLTTWATPQFVTIIKEWLKKKRSTRTPRVTTPVMAGASQRGRRRSKRR